MPDRREKYMLLTGWVHMTLIGPDDSCNVIFVIVWLKEGVVLSMYLSLYSPITLCENDDILLPFFNFF